jgi:hypothetical protein
MKLKINTKGISINVVDISTMTEIFGSAYATLPFHMINSIKIKEISDIGETVVITTINGDEYSAPHGYISEVNGEAITIANPLELFNIINLHLYGFPSF